MRKPIIQTLCIIFLGIFTSCEQSPSPKGYDIALVSTVAEISLLHEKEKILAHSSDSLYQKRVTEYFEKKKIDRNLFESQCTALMKDPKTWQSFMADVSRSIDSLKSVGR